MPELCEGAPRMVILTLPAYNEEKGLPDLLAAFARAMETAGYEYRVVVVDDGSSDGTREVIGKALLSIPIQLLRSRKPGLGRDHPGCLAGGRSDGNSGRHPGHDGFRQHA